MCWVFFDFVSVGLDPQFGTNRGFIPVTLPSNAHSMDEIENSLVYPAMPDAPLAEDLISGRKKDTSAIFPTILKPSDLDPSLAKPKSVQYFFCSVNCVNFLIVLFFYKDCFMKCFRHESLGGFYFLKRFFIRKEFFFF